MYPSVIRVETPTTMNSTAVAPANLDEMLSVKSKRGEEDVHRPDPFNFASTLARKVQSVQLRLIFVLELIH